MDLMESAWHAGEVAAQRRYGLDERLAEVGRQVVRDYLPEQHRAFFAQLPMLFLGALDDAGQPWATALAGAPGFLSTPEAQTLRIAGGLAAGDPLQGLLRLGDQVGTLGLQPVTRRRNRANGVIEAVGEGVLAIGVQQSFGNCPKYIQAREHTAADGAQAGALARPRVRRGAALAPEDRALIESADTLFIASANTAPQAGRAGGVDLSHRGGKPGFVRLDGGDGGEVLTVPDFAGNYFFNTLGNLGVWPRAGLLFIDYASGDMLHLAVEAEVIWEGPEVRAFAGAERLMRFRVLEVVRNAAALPLRWTARLLSPHLERTGSWA